LSLEEAAVIGEGEVADAAAKVMVADVVVMMDRYRYSVNALDRHTVGLDRFHFKLNRLEDDRLDLDGFKKPHFKSERTGPGLARRRNGVLPCGR